MPSIGIPLGFLHMELRISAHSTDSRLQMSYLCVNALSLLVNLATAECQVSIECVGTAHYSKVKNSLPCSWLHCQDNKIMA